MCSGAPCGVSLTAVRVTKGQMNAGKFFILQQNADHVRRAKIGDQGQLANAIAVFLRMAIIPEFLLKVFAVARGFLQTAFADAKNERRALQIAVFSAEMIPRRAIADKRAVNFRGGGENFARWKIGPVAATD